MGPTGDPDAVAHEVAALADRFAALGRRLAEVARGLTDEGAPPGVELIDELDASRSQLADARRRVVDVARAMELSDIPAPEQLSSVQSLQALARAAVEAGEQRAARAAKRRALAVLDRVQELRHRDDARFPALVACQAAAAQLRAALVDVEWPTAHADLTALAEERHPLALLLEFVQRQDALDDARWEQLEDTLVAEFGRPLTVAAARGKLTVGPAPAAVPPDDGEPRPGEWGDEWPTVTIEQPTAPLATRVGPSAASGEEHVAHVRGLIWDALGQDRAGIAFHLATHLAEAHPDASPALPPWLLRAVALGRHVRHANGDAALLLGEDFARVAAWEPDAGEEGRAARLLLAAAALLPALLVPDTGAWSVLRILREEDGGPPLTRFCRTVADYSQGHPPLGLGASAAEPDPAGWRDTIEDLLREIAAWRVRVLGLRTEFPPATDVWRQWLRPDGLIHSLLLPLTVDPWGIEMARGLVERLANDAQIRWEVMETDRRVLGRRVGPDIDSRPAALRELRRRVREAVAFAHRWIALQESRPGRADDEPRRQRRQLAESAHELRTAAAAEVAVLGDPSAPPALRAAGAQWRAALDCVDRLLCDGLARGGEPLPAHLLHADLLRVPGARLDADWQPGQRDDEAVVEGLQKVLASRDGRRDWRRAFDGAVAALDHRASGQIIEYLEADGAGDGALSHPPEQPGVNVDEMRSIRTQALQQCRAALAQAVETTRSTIESAAARGLLTENERGHFSDRAERVALALPEILRFTPGHESLRAIRERLGDLVARAAPLVDEGEGDGDGRQRERAALAAMDGPSLVFGGPNMGTALLLRQIARERHAPAEGQVASYVDIGGADLAAGSPAARLWRGLQDELARAGVLAPGGSADGPVDPDAIAQGIDRWLDGDQARRLLLLIDDADGLLEAEGWTTAPAVGGSPARGRLADLGARAPGRCKVVLAGQHAVQRAARLAHHPLARSGSVRLGPLLDDGGWRAARALARRVVAAAGGHVESADVVDRILARANYRPEGIRRFGELLVGGAADGDGRITGEHVDAVARSRPGRDILAAPLLAATQVDPLYEVIVRILALGYWSPPEDDAADGGDGASSAWLRAQVTAWCGVGRRHERPEEFAGLLDDMVGLALLRRTGADSVALDCPNLVPYLGAEQELLARLFELGASAGATADER